jgi:hypothetical protein
MEKIEAHRARDSNFAPSTTPDLTTRQLNERNRIQTPKEAIVPYNSVNPATGEVLKTFPEHTDEW